jgi:hypothetical protein
MTYIAPPYSEGPIWFQMVDAFWTHRQFFCGVCISPCSRDAFKHDGVITRVAGTWGSVTGSVVRPKHGVVFLTPHVSV